MTDEVLTDIPPPDQITIGESTFIPATFKPCSRHAIGIKIFRDEAEFIEWQAQEPREIFEITPTITSSNDLRQVHVRIFVTYKAGILK